MREKFITLVSLVFALALVACAPLPELPSRSAVNPAGVDLSGSWQLREEAGKSLVRDGEQPQTIQMPRNTSRETPQSEGRRARARRTTGLDVWIFIETGKRLRIAQTVDGVFMHFDRAVVEEYTFGENRTVSVGPIEAQRVSGWIGPVLVLETMDEQGAVLTETWELEDEGSVLVRDIAVIKGDQELFTARQVFDPA